MLDWDQVDTVLLDMDGTLLDLYFDNFFWLEYLPTRYAERRELGLTEARAELVPHMQRIEGTIDWYCLDYWSTALQLDIPALKLEVAHLIAFRPRAEAFLEALGRADKRRVLVTNAHRDSLSIKLERTGLGQYLDAVVSSHDFRLPKESTDFWGALQQVEAFDPARAALIDDTSRVLRSAREYGIGCQLGIARPDSRQEARIKEEFELIECFDQVMPWGYLRDLAR